MAPSDPSLPIDPAPVSSTPSPTTPATTPATTAGRSLAVGIVVGLAIGLATVALVFSIAAVPIYALAQADRSGLDRPFIRTALFRVALPVGGLVGLLIGGLVGRWYRKGGRLPTDRTPW